MNTLLLVDGSNIVMRAAFGGDIEPERAVQIATGLVERAARQVEATHMVICMDSQAPSWRSILYPEYKANRTTDTTPWLNAAQEYWTRKGWYVEEWAGFEADDLIATIGARSVANSKVIACSNDSDILALTYYGVRTLRPVNGGTFMLWNSNAVNDKYGLRFSGQLTDFKAMCGEKSDNVPGVPGIGPARASDLLSKHEGVKDIIEAGGKANASKYAKQVYECRDAALLALDLVTLRRDAPIPPIAPNNCLFRA